MTPADLDAIERDALRDAPRCAACGALATRICRECCNVWCGEHNSSTKPARCCDTDDMEPLPEDARLAMARALRKAWAQRDGALADTATICAEAEQAWANGATMLARLTQERDAALAAVDAVRADYAPRREPPTADEVRALAGLWGKHGAWGGDAACLVFTENVRPHGVGPVPSMLWVTVSMADVVVCDDDGCDALSARMVGGEDAEYVWQALRPEGGALPWSELAALVRGVPRG